MDNVMTTHLGALASARERKAMSLSKFLVCCFPSCQNTPPLRLTLKFSPFLLCVLVPILFLRMSSARCRLATTEEVQFTARISPFGIAASSRAIACLVHLFFFGTIALYAQRPAVGVFS